jgi:hypothetical protein
MKVPEPEWFTIASLVSRWNKHPDDIEVYFRSGKLKPAIHLDGVELYEVTLEYNDDMENLDAPHIYKDPEPADDDIYGSATCHVGRGRTEVNLSLPAMM